MWITLMKHIPVWFCSLLFTLVAAMCFAQTEAPPDGADGQSPPATATLDTVQPSLLPGMPAPGIRVSDWLMGPPLTEFKKGRVYVLDFFMSYVRDSRVFTKPFEDLNRKYGKKATFAAISVMEHDQGDVQAYVKALQGKVSYGIGLDDQARPTEGRGYMSANWLEPSAPDSVPVVFIVDKDQKIAWRGEPAETEGVLQQVLDGKWDSNAYADKIKAQIKDEQTADAAWEQNPIKLELDKVHGLLRSQDYDGALAEIDTLAGMDGTGAKLNPSKEAINLTLTIDMMIKHDFNAYYSTAEKALAVFADDPDYLNNLAWNIVDPDSKMPDKRWDFAIKAATKAVELSKRQNEGYLDTLAWAYYGSGDKKKAVDTEKEAVAVADDVDRVEIQASLDRMQKIAPQVAKK
jgi:tetratricopeptide (TPR) repeat protein